MIFFNLIVKWIKLDFNKWQTWVLGTWAFQQCSPESCIILWPLCPALHTLFHAWRDFGLAFDWRTWLVVCPSSCRPSPASTVLPISCHTLPLFTQTHQRQRRIQIVLMDFSPSNIPNPYTDIKLTQCILEQEQNSIENKKKKKRKKGWGEMIKKMGGMSLAQYLYFTQFLLTTAIMSEWLSWLRFLLPDLQTDLLHCSCQSAHCWLSDAGWLWVRLHLVWGHWVWVWLRTKPHVCPAIHCDSVFFHLFLWFFCWLKVCATIVVVIGNGPQSN